jgi:hypothetical protein
MTRPRDFAAADEAQAVQELADAVFALLNVASRYEPEGLRPGSDVVGRLAVLERVAIATVARIPEGIQQLRGRSFAAAFGARLAAARHPCGGHSNNNKATNKLRREYDRA